MANLFDLGVSLGLTVRAKQDYTPSYTREVLGTFSVSSYNMVVMFKRKPDGTFETTENRNEAEFASLVAVSPTTGESVSFYVGKTKDGDLFDCSAAAYQIVKITKNEGVYKNGKDHFVIAEPV